MATAANWNMTLTCTGDDTSVKTLAAAANAASPAQDQFINLASGANTLTAPTAATPTRLTIIPPVGNTVLMTLKGVTGDAGVPIHKTDPTSVAVDSTCASVCLTAANIVNGVRILWS